MIYLKKQGLRYGGDEDDLEDDVDAFCLSGERDVYVSRKPL